jgi:hypothetical protein
MASWQVSGDLLGIGFMVRAHPGKKQNVNSTKQGVFMEFQGLPPIGQKRPMDGAQFHTPWVGNAGGEVKSAKDGATLAVGQTLDIRSHRRLL